MNIEGRERVEQIKENGRALFKFKISFSEVEQQSSAAAKASAFVTRAWRGLPLTFAALLSPDWRHSEMKSKIRDVRSEKIIEVRVQRENH